MCQLMKLHPIMCHGVAIAIIAGFDIDPGCPHMAFSAQGAAGTPLSRAPHSNIALEPQAPFMSDNVHSHRERLTIWPYRSLSARGFMLVMAALGSLAFCIGLGFFLLGAWPVVGFLGLEILVVWVAFKMNYRAAKRRQNLTATPKELTIETVTPAGERNSTSLPTAWVQVELTPREEPDTASRAQQRVVARSHGRTAEIGSFLHPAEMPKLAREVRHMVSRARNADLNDAAPDQRMNDAGGQQIRS
jgi:uncharacterized membrane protein